MDLFQRYPEYFELTMDMNAVLKLKPDMVRDGKYPITFPKEYFLSEFKPFGNSSTQSSTKPEGSACIMIDDE